MAKSSFWSDHNTEPKRQYRWVLNMGSVDAWLIKKVGKPSFSITESKHQFINHSFYYPGRVEWEKISVTLVDPVTPDASKSMEAIVRAAGYKLPTDAQVAQNTISKGNSVRALGNVSIKQIDADGNPIEEWKLTNAWVTSVKFGELDYSSDEMVEITLELRYDYAELIKDVGNAGVAPASAGY